MAARQQLKLKESQIQRRVVQWLRDREPKPLFCATVGGVDCSSTQRLKMWSTGYEKGIPDLLIYEPRGPYTGFAIEFKSATGVVSEHQRAWLEALQLRGWKTAIHRVPTEAVDDISKYLTTDDIQECPPTTPLQATNSSPTKSLTLPSAETCLAI